MLTKINGLKSTEMSEIPILDTWVLGEILNRFYSFLVSGHIVSIKSCLLKFIKIGHKPIDIYGKKSAIGTKIHKFGIMELEQLWYD